MLCLQFVFFSTFQNLISFEFCSVHCYLVLKRKDKKIASFGDSHFAKSDGFRRQKDCQKIANEKRQRQNSLCFFLFAQHLVSVLTVFVLLRPMLDGFEQP